MLTLLGCASGTPEVPVKAIPACASSIEVGLVQMVLLKTAGKVSIQGTDPAVELRPIDGVGTVLTGIVEGEARVEVGAVGTEPAHTVCVRVSGAEVVAKGRQRIHVGSRDFHFLERAADSYTQAFTAGGETIEVLGAHANGLVVRGGAEGWEDLMIVDAKGGIETLTFVVAKEPVRPADRTLTLKVGEQKRVALPGLLDAYTGVGFARLKVESPGLTLEGTHAGTMNLMWVFADRSERVAVTITAG